MTSHRVQALWSAQRAFKAYPTLAGDLEVDIAIIGAGITGLSAAYLLSQAGRKVVVLEDKEVGWGTTGSSTGNLYAPVDVHLANILAKHGEETLRTVAACRTEAVDFIAQLIQTHAIDCAFGRAPWFLFTHDSVQAAQIDRELEAARMAGLLASNATPTDFPYQRVAALVQVADQAQLDPLAYVRALAGVLPRDLVKIYENTTVVGVQDGQPCLVQTRRGNIKAQQVIMATHTPKGIYAVQAMMECKREHAIAVRLKAGLPAPGIYWHQQQDQHYSVRPHRDERGEYLVVLGEPMMVGQRQLSQMHFDKLETYARTYFPVEEVAYAWAAQNYRPADLLPYIGTGFMENNVYIATGFAADGLVWGTVAAMIISDLIQGKANPWAKVYDPRRFTPVASAPTFIKENINVASNLVRDYLSSGEIKELDDVQVGEGKLITAQGEKLAVHRDEQSQLHIVSAVCPHMGCIVHWNDAERTWDCPCHGSRFGVDGEVLEGPAFHGLQPKGIQLKR
jgi:glycine/D-amino acid oxidase-like deaminating enzyme/nitrite reductase/ring-hydroxylating ferredoxin subunit